MRAYRNCVCPSPAASGKPCRVFPANLGQFRIWCRYRCPAFPMHGNGKAKPAPAPCRSIPRSSSVLWLLRSRRRSTAQSPGVFPDFSNSRSGAHAEMYKIWNYPHCTAGPEFGCSGVVWLAERRGSPDRYVTSRSGPGGEPIQQVTDVTYVFLPKAIAPLELTLSDLLCYKSDMEMSDERRPA